MPSNMPNIPGIYAMIPVQRPGVLLSLFKVLMSPDSNDILQSRKSLGKGWRGGEEWQ